MINAILTGILNFVFNLVSTILDPIDNIIVQNAPQIEGALNAFSDLIDYVISFLAYVVDLTGLSPTSIYLIVSYLTFALTWPVVVWVIKVVVKWWHMLVP